MKSEFHKTWRRRLLVLQGVFMLLLLAIGARFYDLQVRRHVYFGEKADRQYQKRVKIASRRGTIYDRHKHELAVSVDVDSVCGIPSQFQDSSRIRQLAATLDISSKKLKAKLSSSKSFVWIKRQVTPKQANAVRGLGLSGIKFIKESRRYYPQKELAASLLGFVGTDNQGLEGIECYYEDWLKGNPQVVNVGDENTVKTYLENKDALRGSDLILTIDKTIQYIAQAELAKACEEFGAKRGVVIVMDAQNGELLGMAGFPEFNPNSFGKYSPDYWRNRAITDCYEPGSIIKVFTAAAAIEERLFEPKDRLWCEQGAIRVAGHTIHDNASYGDLSFSQVLEFSSNVGAVKIGLALGKNRLYDYLSRFSFGNPTGVGLPGERGGILRSPDDWSKVSIGSVSIGQEISATPLQLVNAVCTIANGGLLLKPRIVKQIWDNLQQRPLKEFGRQVGRRVISENTCKVIKNILVKAVAQGSGKKAALTQYRVAGKTGSAQKVDPATGAYSKDKWVAWFLGFAPADNPRLAMVVMLDEPKKGEWASDVAAPVFGRIAQGSLKYLGVSVDRIEPKIRRAGKKAAPKRPARSSVKKSEGKLVWLPNLKGKSMRRVLAVLSERGLQVELEGSGRAIAQEPKPGSRLEPGSLIRVSFAPINRD